MILYFDSYQADMLWDCADAISSSCMVMFFVDIAILAITIVALYYAYTIHKRVTKLLEKGGGINK